MLTFFLLVMIKIFIVNDEHAIWVSFCAMPQILVEKCVVNPTLWGMKPS